MEPSLSRKILAISGSLALIAFLLIGFLFGAWHIAWVVFLVPGMAKAWTAVGNSPKKQVHGYGINDDGEERPYPVPHDKV